MNPDIKINGRPMEWTEFSFCPLHKAAPAMYEALKAVVSAYDRDEMSIRAAAHISRAAIATADGKS